MASNIASSSSSSSASTATADKLRTALEHKARGNAAFTQNDMQTALAAYHHAVLYLSGLETRSILGLVGENSGREGKPEDLSSDDDAEGAESEKHLSTVYSNMAACYLKQHNYTRAVEVADKSIRCDSRNVKAKYRKAQALRLAGELYAAQQFGSDTLDALRSKRKASAAEVESFERELKAVQSAIRAKEVRGREKWKGFLGRNPGVLDSAASQSQSGVAEAEAEAAEKESQQ
ncbi:uncharacterized protein SRS1_13850 [Sporisorium reilianum f. sp. reilianum]|uniref:Uncharacterized protein n=1 Tax=Sporisorium reilianum f. sp. reilianum TaxID=72559 RepID=A0A2N8UDG0_9BASI|nr:uncharacterized protein SRS1_13850 [Sporisorium reilianum f. sp. reilianum]